MNDQQIKELALKCGFKERPQDHPSGYTYLDLNPYVYEFAKQLLAATQTNVTPAKLLELLERASNLERFASQLKGHVFRLEKSNEWWRASCQLLASEEAFRSLSASHAATVLSLPAGQIIQ